MSYKSHDPYNRPALFARTRWWWNDWLMRGWMYRQSDANAWWRASPTWYPLMSWLYRVAYFVRRYSAEWYWLELAKTRVGMGRDNPLRDVPTWAIHALTQWPFVRRYANYGVWQAMPSARNREEAWDIFIERVKAGPGASRRPNSLAGMTAQELLRQQHLQFDVDKAAAYGRVMRQPLPHVRQGRYPRTAADH